MAIATNLGFPRIGVGRELKRALERHWSGDAALEALVSAAADIRRWNWELQRDRGLAHIPSNDFSLYDHVLDTCAMVGAVPPRFGNAGDVVATDTYFAMARGSSVAAPMEMTKWFDTNYHYIVPELEPGQEFHLASTKPVDEFLEAKALGIHTRPVLVGPVTFLVLGKSQNGNFARTALLDGILPVYVEVLRRLASAGADWVQMDEPILALDLAPEVQQALRRAYARLAAVSGGPRLLVASYFGDIGDNLPVALALPVAGIHLDAVRGSGQLERAGRAIPSAMSLSAGVVDGRNVWCTDLERALLALQRAATHVRVDRLMVAPSCSLLHVPISLSTEPDLADDLRSWLAFGAEKLDEITLLTRGVNEGAEAVTRELDRNRAIIERRCYSDRIHNPSVKARVNAIDQAMLHRASPYTCRRRAQTDKLALPRFPTTTIGSFPQTPEVRRARAAHAKGEATRDEYESFVESQIESTIRAQERLGIDVLVHGEFERKDMVEYFGEQLAGIAFTQGGWVQSYGSRYVKPPIIYGDVSRPHPMTVRWSAYAQSLTGRPVKGMLTGPVTILRWSFVRDDQPQRDTAYQIALSLREEVADLERAGIRIIQIDEPAFREGLPLRREQWPEYLEWAVGAFRLASSGVTDETQIHTHMCYSEFNDVIEAIADMDADVISIEASRSDMALLRAFARFRYPNAIGPGVYDIHSPRVPSVEEIEARLRTALTVLSAEQLWVNPDCGLKTRGWPEVEASLGNMVAAAARLRETPG